eukprot:scaffold69661_cov63-Phaeocystis_antarctica.AAC.3
MRHSFANNKATRVACRRLYTCTNASSKPRQRGQSVLHEEVSWRWHEKEGVDAIEQPAVAGE